MLELYITKGVHDCVISNDAFFDFDVSNGRKKFDKICRDFMKKIDDAEYVDRYTVKSGLTNYNVSICNLSTGCKTLLNILRHPDKIFYMGECGDNVLEHIFNLKTGKICMNLFFIPPSFCNDILCKIEYSGESLIIHNGDELEDKLYDIFYNRNY